MQYKSYQHIEKLGTSEVEGILNGEVHLSYKIDGSNGVMFLKDDDSLGFGSRKRELNLENDNAGFVKHFMGDSELFKKYHGLLKLHPSWYIFGEWLIPVNIKRYKDDAWKTFYVFDIYDNESHRYLRFDEYVPILIEFNIPHIPEIAVIKDPTEEEIKEYLQKTGDFLLSEGMGEGIVIKNYEYRNIYGRSTWAKILTEDFRETRRRGHQKKKEAIELDYQIEQTIINKYLRVEQVNKEK